MNELSTAAANLDYACRENNIANAANLIRLVEDELNDVFREIENIKSNSGLIKTS